MQEFNKMFMDWNEREKIELEDVQTSDYKQLEKKSESLIRTDVITLNVIWNRKYFFFLLFSKNIFLFFFYKNFPILMMNISSMISSRFKNRFRRFVPAVVINFCVSVDAIFFSVLIFFDDYFYRLFIYLMQIAF